MAAAMGRRKELAPGDQRREELMLRELRRFHRENAHLLAPLASTATKKRLRVPRVDIDVNPFCADRQLADEYELHNLNKNPRFYINTIRNSPRIEENPHNHSSFVNDAADLLASSGFSPRIRAEFTGAVPPAAYRPIEYQVPKVISVDPSDLRSIPADHPLSPTKNTIHVVSKLVPPTHPHYTNTRAVQPASFGHRPRTASRLYAPLTASVGRKQTAEGSDGSLPSPSQASTPVRTGMSVMQLQELLTPTKTKAQHENLQPQEASRGPKSRRLRVPEQDDEEQRQTLEVLERGFNNETYYPPKARRAIQFRPPTDQTTAQLIDKYRKLAVGKLPSTS